MVKKFLLAAAAIGFSVAVQAEVVQDCKLEGVVKETQSKDGVKAVYIDFHSIKRYSDGTRCNMRGKDVEFDGVVGSQIQQVEPGTGVTYRYIQDDEKAPAGQWQLLEVSI